ncbi:hypothetical protein G6F56_010985 [Rhizopus delemar]|nr:hypothetical protein G6F56_010985 [Rhizopus delemar]
MNENLSNNPSADYHINEDFYTTYYSFLEASVQHGQSRAFKCPDVNQSGFTRSLVNTMNFADIINEHNISRNASRQLVRFVRTVKENKQSIEDEPGVHYQETLENRLEAVKPVTSFKYYVCVYGYRYQNQGSNIPRKTFQMLSISDQISLALLNKDTREKMLYRSRFEYDPEVSADTFSGKRYQSLLERGFFAGQNDVALILQIESFSPSDKGNSNKLNMVQLVNINVPPQ